MSKELSIWNRPWNKGRGLFAWIAILFCAAFVIIFCLTMLTDQRVKIGSAAVVALCWSAGIVAAGWFILWIRRRGNLRRVIFALICLVTAIALFYAEENWRGKKAWENYRRGAEAKGEKFERSDFIPPAVPDEQNFAMTPFLSSLFDFKPGTQTHTITNWYSQMDTLGGRSNRMDFTASQSEHLNSWTRSVTDLPGWYAAFLEHPPRDPANSFSDTSSASNLASQVLIVLQRSAPILDEIRQASHRPYARFNIRYENDDPTAILLPHLAILKQMTLILQLRSSAHLTGGQVNEAMDDIKLMFYLMETVRPEPILISQLVRFAELQLILQPIAQGLEAHQWSESQLQFLEEKLIALDFCADARFALNAERAFFGGGLLDYFRHLNFRQRMDFFNAVAEWPNAGKPNPLWAWLSAGFMPTGWSYLEQLNYDRAFQVNIDPIISKDQQRISPELARSANQQIEGYKSPVRVLLQHQIFCKIFLPSLTNVAKKAARGQTAANLAGIACALERYRSARGNYPDALEALMPEFMAKIPQDVINGQALHYQRRSDGSRIIYSVGWNETDDGGRIVLSNGSTPKIDYDLGDWVWQLPAQ